MPAFRHRQLLLGLARERWGASGRKEGNTPTRPAEQNNTATVPRRTFVRFLSRGFWAESGQRKTPNLSEGGVSSFCGED